MAWPGLDLAGRCALVTGASSGIGLACSEALTGLGADVLMVARDAGRLQAQAERVQEAGTRLGWHAADLSMPDGRTELVARMEQTGRELEVLVHCAGLFEPAAIEDVTLESFRRQLEVNVVAPFALTQSLVSLMPEGSSIVFISSAVVHYGVSQASAYSATKGAVEAMVRALAVELAPRRIRVNAVAPGLVRTPMIAGWLAGGNEPQLAGNTLVGRLGEAQDIASVVCLLSSPMSGYIDGETIVADGGVSVP